MAGYGDRYPWELSGGQQQRVSLCRALIHNPGLLLMDEPFGALDALTREQLQRDLERMWLAQKPTVLFVTHDVGEAVCLADRVVVLVGKPGAVVADIRIGVGRARGADLLNNPQLQAYAKDVRAVLLPHESKDRRGSDFDGVAQRKSNNRRAYHEQIQEGHKFPTYQIPRRACLAVIATATSAQSRRSRRRSSRSSSDWAGPTSAASRRCILGVEKGFFKEQGIDLTISEGKGTVVSAAAVANGSDDFGYFDVGSVSLLIDKGLAVRGIAQIRQKTAAAYISMKSSGIDRPEKIVGHSVALTPGASTTQLFAGFVAANWRRHVEDQAGGARPQHLRQGADRRPGRRHPQLLRLVGPRDRKPGARNQYAAVRRLRRQHSRLRDCDQRCT